MSINYNGKEYGVTKVINYSAAPDYNRGIVVDNIQSGNYVATDNGFLLIQLQSQQSNPTKVSVIRSKTPITDTGTEIASIVISQYQYSETLVAQVMARDYYKLVIEGVGNPQILSCMFYPYATTVPIKLTENIGIEQVEGLESELAGKQNAGNYATNTALNDGLATKQDKGNYFNKNTDKLNLANQVENVLGIANGGTGTNDGYLFANMMTLPELRTRFTALGSTAVTTEQFINAIDNSVKTVFKVNLVSANIYISDCPLTNAILEVIRLTDNTVILTLKDLFVLTTYEFRKTPDGQFSGWKKTRNSDGSIPIAMGGTGNTVGAMPYSSNLTALGQFTDTFDITLDIGETATFMTNTEAKVFTWNIINEGTYDYEYISFTNNILSDRRRVLLVITPSNKTQNLTANFRTAHSITRIK